MPSWVPITGSLNPCIPLCLVPERQRRGELKAPRGSRAPRGLEFQMKLQVEQNAFLANKLGFCEGLSEIARAHTPAPPTNMLCLLMLSAKSYKVGIQNALRLRQTADAPLLGFGPESFPSGEGGEMGRAGSWALLQRFKGAGRPDARKQRPKT